MLNYYLFITPKAAHNTTSQLLRQKIQETLKTIIENAATNFYEFF